MIRKILFAGIFGLAASLNTMAQSKLPAVYTILEEGSGYVPFPDSCWQMLEDAEGKWTIDQVSQMPLAERFHANHGFNYTITTYWTRFVIRNKTSRDISISFKSQAPYHDLFSKMQGGTWSHQRTGWLVPWSEKDGIRGLDAIPVAIPAGEEVVIYRKTKYDFRLFLPRVFGMGIFFTQDFLRNSYVTTQSNGLDKVMSDVTFGLFLLTAILSVFFYRTTREKEFIKAATGYAVVALMFFSDTLSTLFKEHPLFIEYTVRIIGRTAVFFIVYLPRVLLHTRTRLPRWDKVLVLVSVMPILDVLLQLISAAVVMPFNTQVVAMVASIVTCVYLIKEKDRTARLVIIGFLPILISTLANYLWGVLNGPDLQNFWAGLSFICLLWLITSLNRILFYRYEQLQTKLASEELAREQLAKEKEREKRILIEQQKVDLESQVHERTKELSLSIDHLKSTQSQLIQSEKMASLGELTAGIAHEIQNPLNFVNNFSEVNNELIDELKTELESGNQQLAKGIANDIKNNLEKINHHGKRADAIVKGMLQHSRNSSGQKELTDINALCDEYLRLSYHGLRAKDKLFNAKLETDFDASLPDINVVPQDIGRVVLNLINNAFYAVSEKGKHRISGYEPTVKVITKLKSGTHDGIGRITDIIKITVKDNGTGIPQQVIDKIFQPFFTTKPTGQGTGLGLSLSYDILKMHGGELKVETTIGEGSEFIIQLPY